MTTTAVRIAEAMLTDTLPSTDELLAKRADIVRHLAPLRAIFGGNGYAAERRIKLVESRLDGAMRAKWDATGTKYTEPKVAAAIREHAEYIQALTEDLTQRELWIDLEEQLNEIEWRLRMRQTDGALLSAEARLTSIGV